MASPPMALLTFTLPVASTMGNALKTSQYSMALTARSVVWKYQLSNLSSTTLNVNTEQATLASQSEIETVTTPSLQGLDVNNKSIQSDTAIKLKQAPWLGIELTDGAGHPMINNLPNPQVENIYPVIESTDGFINREQPQLSEGSFYADIPVRLPSSTANVSAIEQPVTEGDENE